MTAWILLLACLAWAQDNSAPKETFLAGTVVEITAEKITVTRTVLGKKDENRTFKITPSTKVEGNVRAKDRVTVHYKSGDDGDVAVSIKLRQQQKKK